MERSILIVGEGMIAEDVSDRLSGEYDVHRQPDFEAGVPEETGLVLIVHDAWRPSLYREAEEILRPAGIPWLRGFISFGEGVIGPLVSPGGPGCSACADMRRFIAGPDSNEMRVLEQIITDFRRNPWASRAGCRHIARLICTEIKTFMEQGPGSLEQKVRLINLLTLESTSHFYMPEPLCEVCGNCPDDTAENARISLQPSPKPDPDSYRSRPAEDIKDALRAGFLDSRTGIFNGKMYDAILPFADTIVNMPLWIGNEGVGGRTHSYEESELTAVLEGLERYSGIKPRGKRTMTFDCYRNVKDQALDPRKTGLHDEGQYEQPDFPFRPFDQDRPLHWVWGYSFSEKRPILVPESLAYYSLGREDSFVYETSNGCSMGGTLEEAIFHAILEVVERDSFLLTWYARLPLREIDLRSCEHAELRIMTERVRAVAGYDLHVYNSTMEHGIPSIWAVAKNRKRDGLNLLCTAGAHPNPVKAVKSALHELAGMMLKYDSRLEAERGKYEEMLQDPFLVQNMEEHSMLYGLPEAEERLRFLLDQHQKPQTFQEAFKQVAKNRDIKEDLEEFLDIFRRLNLEVIVVDQTSPITKRNGLYCVKVLIPGMLPMTFGHRLIRLAGLERVFTVPVKLGFKKEALTPGELNPHPHPFP
ncbi:TOMM precursor leader peptide-binding protein [Bacillus glycinifermentans]|uniref:TOMM precursor leader peptide-binding protein n=1 Tax=Bacillus glycinifermentans TaxID=1664069 RepID=UPI002DBE41BB|nr:TOMM precursor leader peptide-binding protein [Bacillus glycinifermentans]MEC3606437.1 TOMM precursor leader peptide-binding protein [Bacillus glycinifermentans]